MFASYDHEYDIVIIVINNMSFHHSCHKTALMKGRNFRSISFSYLRNVETY